MTVTPAILTEAPFFMTIPYLEVGSGTCGPLKPSQFSIMDLLSDVLSVVRMNGGAFFTAEFTSPWSVYTPTPDELAQILQTRAECVAAFHIFVEGECWIGLDGVKPFQLTAGSAIIFSRSPSHRLGSRPDIQPEPLVRLFESVPDKSLPRLVHGGGGSTTRFFCGYLQCDHRFGPLAGSLPELLIAAPNEARRGPVSDHGENGADGGPAPRFAVIPAEDPWLRHTKDHLVKEAFNHGAGTPTMLNRLIELFYLEMLRRYAVEASIPQGGWFAGMNDPYVGSALRAMHADPARHWTVEELAAEAGLSRSAFASRFSTFIHSSPMRYLTTWRMELAKSMLRQGNGTLLEVAARVGYESEAAFNRAFKREIGEPPGTWRNRFS